MEDWEKTLYDSYVSSGQATAPHTRGKLDSLYFNKYIFPYLPSNRAAKIVDLACGQGRMLSQLKNVGYSNFEGVDLSPEQVAVALENGLAEISSGDILEYLLDKPDLSIDVVILLDIVEHLDMPVLLRLLRQLERVTRTGGTVLIRVPNANGIFGLNVRYGDLTHRRAFTKDSIRQLLSLSSLVCEHALEEAPLVHSLGSFFRRIAWTVLTLPFRLVFVAESGSGAFFVPLSQSMTVIARAK